VSPFNLIFNLGNRKQSGGNKSGEFGVVIKGCNIFWWSKIGKHFPLRGQAHYCATVKISRTKHSWMNPMNALQEAIHFTPL
jgi:hypothetical protein